MVGGLCNFTCNCFSQDNSSGSLKHKMHLKIDSSESHNNSRQGLNGGFIAGTLKVLKCFLPILISLLKRQGNRLRD